MIEEICSLDLPIYHFRYQVVILMSSVYIYIETCFYKHLVSLGLGGGPNRLAPALF